MSEDLLKHLEHVKQKKNLCENLSYNYDKALELESLSVSTHSPGIVKTSEDIARQIFSPRMIEKDGITIKSTAFDDVSNKGLSTNRLSHTTEEEIHIEGENKAVRDALKTQKERGYEGFATAQAGKIRQISEDDMQIFAIYDTSLKSDISHCDVCLLKHKGDGETSAQNAKRKRRKKLQRIFWKTNQTTLALIKIEPNIVGSNDGTTNWRPFYCLYFSTLKTCSRPAPGTTYQTTIDTSPQSSPTHNRQIIPYRSSVDENPVSMNYL